MHGDPIFDLFNFLIGNTGDYNRFGSSKYISVIFYLGLLAGGLYIAFLNWSRDPEQRTAYHFWVAAMRITAAGMWIQGTIWKLPLPVAAGFKYWLEQEAKYSSVPILAMLVHSLFIPNIALLQPVVYLLEILFTISLTLGIAVRLIGIAEVLFTLQLWLGLYNDPTEWPWTYMAIIYAHGMFAAACAGRSLGLDHLLRRGLHRVPASSQPLVARIYALSS
ncbi:DoxX family protein [Lichenicola cladoniae]|uniref:DoxX family protein n=1 Tax=Lichenicola cladoniae TaxID=1484109 RepID=A0A6M8HLW3_9PROT|nr:DoxX family protein [Lichenicola cladoniae]NPD69899.1 DoxX family protein [Acetobacteraceae bacterium]QKE89321.1 DoxX family protein [Lichenicola cladoniae]